MKSFREYINESTDTKLYDETTSEQNVMYWYNVLQTILDMKKKYKEIPLLTRNIIDGKTNAVESFFDIPLEKINSGLELLDKNEKGNYPLPSFSSKYKLPKKVLSAKIVEKTIPQLISSVEDYRTRYQKFEKAIEKAKDAKEILTAEEIQNLKEKYL